MLASNLGGVRSSDDCVDHPVHCGGQSFQFCDRLVRTCLKQNALAGCFSLTAPGTFQDDDGSPSHARIPLFLKRKTHFGGRKLQENLSAQADITVCPLLRGEQKTFAGLELFSL
jgi:hypothetical protein